MPVGFGTGITVYFSLGTEPGLAIGIVLTILVVLLRARIERSSLLRALLMLTASATAGFACIKLATDQAGSPTLKRKIYNATVEGYVERIEPRQTRGPRVTVRVIRLLPLKQAEQPERVRVRFMRRKTSLRPGQAIRFKAVLAPPARPALPGGYDFARSAYFMRLGAVGYVRGPAETLAGAPPAPLSLRLAAAVQQIRQDIGQRITSALPGERGAIANALMTGERGLISKATLDAYRNSGILHILSISGLHMAIMAGSVFVALRLLMALSPFMALNYPIKKIAAVLAIFSGLAYLLISGTTHATLRAFVMILIMMLAITLDRPAIAMRNVALAALALLLVQPSSLLNVGFQMSFAAVIALVAAYEAVRDHRATQAGTDIPRGWMMAGLLFFAGIIGSTVVASAAVTPISAFHFHKGQLFSVLTNLIAVPICNFIVMPAALLSFVLMPLGLEALPLWLMGYGIDLMTWCARSVAALPGAVVHIPAFGPGAFGFMVAGGLWLCLWRRAWRMWGLAPIAVGIALVQATSQSDVLIGRDGRLVAVRHTDSRLTVLSTRGTKFELTRWLEHDGDPRDPRTVASAQQFRCDRVGCTFRHTATLLAVSKSPASLADDCSRAQLLVLRYPKPKGCRPNGKVIDLWAMRDQGTHALKFGPTGALTIQTVEQYRGRRPWTLSSARPPTRRTSNAKPKTRLKAFAANRALAGPDENELRPDVDDQDHFWRQ